MAFICYKIIQQLNEDRNLENLQMKYAIRLGWLCLKLRLSERAIDPLNNGLRISHRFTKFYKDQIEGLKLLANSYRNVGDYEKAISTYDNTLALSQKANDRNSEAIILYMLGKLYCNYLNQIPRGIDYLYRALAIFKDADNKLYYAICLDELGSANLDMSSIFENDQKDFLQHMKKIINLHKQSLKIVKEINYLPGANRNLCHLGLAYCRWGI
ncbi:MAG: tetratricopeptide repeat protein [Candidatus Hodarchaeota archaeon]